MICSDDIGSFPLPPGADRDRLQATALELASSGTSEGGEEFNSVVSSIMQQKLDSGVMHPTYPQIQDMVNGFFQLIDGFQLKNRPWVIDKSKAVVPEVEAVREVAGKYYQETGNPVELRVCVTGPVELYVKNIGPHVEADLLYNIAESVSMFIENTLVKEKYLKTTVYSIDDPSIGLNPNIIIEDEAMVKAWDITAKPARKLDVQVHLHSPSSIDRLYQTKHVNVIGVESAENPRDLKEFNKKDLESQDKFLRVGIARTNINAIAGDYLHEKGVDVWKTRKFDTMLDEMESLELMKKRLREAYKMFGDKVKYAGPDCGLGSWPSQEVAKKQLTNASQAVGEFNTSRK